MAEVVNMPRLSDTMEEGTVAKWFKKVGDFVKEGDIYVHCAGGYRSVIAISILKQKGFKNLIDVAGGFGAIKKSDLNKSCYNSVVKCSG